MPCVLTIQLNVFVWALISHISSQAFLTGGETGNYSVSLMSRLSQTDICCFHILMQCSEGFPFQKFWFAKPDYRAKLKTKSMITVQCLHLRPGSDLLGA